MSMNSTLTFDSTLHTPGKPDEFLFAMRLTTNNEKWTQFCAPLQSPFLAVRSWSDLTQLRVALDLKSPAFPSVPSSEFALQFLRDLLAGSLWNAKPLVEFFIDRQDTLIYDTAAVCPRCALHDRRGIVPERATVVRREHSVFLVMQCKQQHRSRTLYASDYLFFIRQMSFAMSVPSPAAIGDIESLSTRFAERPTSDAPPFIVQIPLFESGQFRSDDAIRSDIELTRTFYPANRKFIVKALAGAALDMQELNRKALFLVSLLPDRPLLLELTYERLVVLCERDDSCFVKAGIYPAVKYFIEAGNETQCERELARLCDTVAQFEGIQVTITLVVEPPIENLQLRGALQLLRSKASLVRVVTIQLSRSPRALLQAAAAAAPAAGEEQSFQASDPLQFLRLLDVATDGQVQTSDFVPASIGACLEPILNVMGHGFFYLRPSPYCGMATCLVNSGSHRSVPLTRLFDVVRFWFETQTLLPRLQDGTVGFINAKRLQKALRQCLRAEEAGIADIWPYLTSASNAERTKQFIDNLQFIVIHNHMDVAAFDAVRRCQCAMVSIDQRGFVASCTNCL
jgi:hypothetical protein